MNDIFDTPVSDELEDKATCLRLYFHFLSLHFRAVIGITGGDEELNHIMVNLNISLRKTLPILAADGKTVGDFYRSVFYMKENTLPMVVEFDRYMEENNIRIEDDNGRTPAESLRDILTF